MFQTETVEKNKKDILRIICSFHKSYGFEILNKGAF
jgi:hypothetical protein